MTIDPLMGLGQSLTTKTTATYASEQNNFQQTLEKMQKLQNQQKKQNQPVTHPEQAAAEEQTAAVGGSKIMTAEEDAALKKACQEIEAIFIQQMLKQMRATVPKSELIPESSASNLYQDMLDSEYSKLMSESSQSFGIADMLYKQLKGR